MSGSMAGLARADERILLSVARLPHPPALVRAAHIVTGLGEARVARLVGPALAALAATDPATAAAAAATATADIAAGAAVRKVACALIGRSRPPARYWLAHPVGHSFPSRHTTYAALALGAGTRAIRRGHGKLLPCSAGRSGSAGSTSAFTGALT